MSCNPKHTCLRIKEAGFNVALACALTPCALIMWAILYWILSLNYTMWVSMLIASFSTTTGIIAGSLLAEMNKVSDDNRHNELLREMGDIQTSQRDIKSRLMEIESKLNTSDSEP